LTTSQIAVTTKQTEFDISNEPLTTIAKEIGSLMAQKMTAQGELETANQALKFLDGLSLDQMKAEFEKIYAGGTNNGTAGAKYTVSDLQLMRSLLDGIASEMPGKVLDTTYNDYQNDLKINVDDKERATLTIDTKRFINNISKGMILDKKTLKELGFNNEEVARSTTLPTIRSQIADLMSNIRKLTDSEKYAYDAIDDFLNNRTPQDTPTSDLTEDNLQNSLGLTDKPSADLLGK